MLRDDRAVSPVIAYILTFAITSGFLIITLMSSATLLDRKHREAARHQFDNLTHRIANALEESIYVVNANPDAHYEKRLPLPDNVRGFDYEIDVDDRIVHVNATNGQIRTDTVVHNPNDRDVEGHILRALSARIAYDPGPGVITLEEGD